jgi:protein-S-isoprenylcysteine O-methyltransferase Ste14
MCDNMPAAESQEQVDRRSVISVWLIRTCIGVIVAAVILFWPAGRLDWAMGWIYIVSLPVIAIVTVVVVDPGLIAERNQRRHTNQKGWDRVLFGLYGMVMAIAIPVIAGLNVRYGWQPEVPLWVQLAGLVGYAAGWGINLWAMAKNRFFAQVVRIQRDRGQQTIDTGPYRYVRHPGYVGGIGLTVCTGLMLGSLWALIAGMTGGLLLLLRTELEDQMLQEELEGYREYAQRVRYRLLPGVW